MINISIVSHKGGTGKTTLAYNIAGMLAKRGWNVLVGDLDPQGQIAKKFRCRPAPNQHTLADALALRTTLSQITLRANGYDSLWVAPADTRLAGIQSELMAMQDGRYRLKELLQPDAIASRFDIGIWDTPPTRGVLVDNGIIASNYVLIPLECTVAAAEQLPDTWASLEGARKYCQWEGKLLHVIPNKYREAYTEDTLSRSAMQKFLERKRGELGMSAWLQRVQFEGGILYPIIHDRAAIGNAWLAGDILTDQNPPTHTSVQEFLLLVKSIESILPVKEYIHA